jgi:saccharopine dehydrogenase (NAD+, L-lysine forming)
MKSRAEERTAKPLPLQKSTFGIVGGYGATGRAVVAELLKSGDGELLIGGRDPAKLKSVTAELRNGVSAARVDVLDTASLDEFCSRCSVIVNCAGPVMSLQDRVAQAAFRQHCHYVDAAGMGVVRERMLPHNREIVALGLSYVISAGWAPGLTEFLPVSNYARAKSTMDSIESVSAYSSDSGEWSPNALRDGVAFIRRTGLAKPGYFHKGEWARARTSEASRKVDLGDPIGLRRFSLFSMPELNDVGHRLTDCDFFPYAYLADFRNAVGFLMIAFLPLSEDSSVRLLRNMFRRNHLAVAGFVVARVVGRSEGRAATLTTRVTFLAGQDYWMSAVALATVARMVSARQGVQSGVHYLSATMDPIAFMAELRKAGVQQTERFEFGA